LVVKYCLNWFQEVAISLPPPRPISPKPVPIVTSLVEDQYGYAVQKEIKLKDVPEKNGEIRRSGKRSSLNDVTNAW